MPPILHYASPSTGRDLPEAMFSSHDDPLAAERTIHFHERQQGFVTGSSVSVDTDLLIEAFPWVELGIVETGELRLQGEGFDLHLSAGDCFVVPRGARVRWHHRGKVQRLFMAFAGLQASSDMPRVPIKLDLTQTLSPCNPPAANVLLTPAPKAWSETLFSVANLRIGLWQCEAYARQQVEPSYSELMFLLEGAVTLTHQSAKRYVVRAGETVVVPKGATNAWSSEETVRKVFCILS